MNLSLQGVRVSEKSDRKTGMKVAKKLVGIFLGIYAKLTGFLVVGYASGLKRR
jgi:hypothetical protein